MFEIKLYKPDFKSDWDELVERGKISSFLFKRDFMEYHSDRFEDYSLTFWEEGRLIAVLPANKKGGKVYSHQGLTYGGFVFDKAAKMPVVLNIFREALKFMQENSISHFIYKSTPRIYNTVPADEVDWALTLCEANLYRRDSTLAINNNDPINYQERRLRSIKKGGKLMPEVRENSSEAGVTEFWENILVPNMEAKFGLKPVHTSGEMVLLMNRFPENIRQFNIFVADRIMAGCTMFINKHVAHAQYISGSEEGRKNGCLDYLFNVLIKNTFRHIAYFDFGNSNENNGRGINRGLLDWKEGFGARAISHDFYEVETAKYTFLDDVCNN